MTAAPFDTLKLSRQLRDRAHFNQDQAEGFAEVLAKAFQQEIATKTDLASLEQRLTSKMLEIEQRLKSGNVEPEPLRRSFEAFQKQHFDVQREHLTETYKSLVTLSTEGFKFCALANGGAAVAILAYLGNVAGKDRSVSMPDMRWTMAAMAAFLFGLFCCGVAMFFAYLTQLERLNSIVQGTPQRKKKQDRWLTVAKVCALLSLVAFAIGSFLGLISFFK
jgi:hypothetical protein